MPYYRYKALGFSGDSVKETTFFQNDREFFASLSGRKLSLISYKIKKLKLYKVSYVDLRFLFSYIKRLSDIGISISEILTSFAEETRKIQTKNLGLFLLQEVLEGNTLSSAMRGALKNFTPKQCSAMEFAESSNNLPYACENILRDMESKRRLSNKLMKAMAYPTMLFIMVIVIFIFNVKFVIPKFTDLMSTFGTGMPSKVETMVSVYEYVERNIGYIVGGFVLVLFLNFTALKTSRRYRFFISRAITKIPIFGYIVILLNLTRFFSALSNAYRNDMNLLNALEESKSIIQNYSIRNDMAHVISSIESGSRMYTVLRQFNYIPRLMQRILRTGEEGGDFLRSLDDVTNFYIEDIDLRVNKILSFIKPFAVLVMAGMLLLIISTIFLPMYQNVYNFAGNA